MPQIRHNYFFGIRTPWTLANETVWKKTHRVGGAIFVIDGIALVVTGLFFKEVAYYVMFMGIAVMTIGSAGYSIYIFKRNEKSEMTEAKNKDAE